MVFLFLNSYNARWHDSENHIHPSQEGIGEHLAYWSRTIYRYWPHRPMTRLFLILLPSLSCVSYTQFLIFWDNLSLAFLTEYSPLRTRSFVERSNRPLGMLVLVFWVRFVLCGKETDQRDVLLQYPSPTEVHLAGLSVPFMKATNTIYHWYLQQQQSFVPGIHTCTVGYLKGFNSFTRPFFTNSSALLSYRPRYPGCMSCRVYEYDHTYIRYVQVSYWASPVNGEPSTYLSIQKRTHRNQRSAQTSTDACLCIRSLCTAWFIACYPLKTHELTTAAETKSKRRDSSSKKKLRYPIV